MQADRDILRRCALFTELSDEQLADLATYARHRHVAAAEVIFHKGDPGISLFVIKTGEVKISISAPNESEMTVAILGPNDVMGELAVLDDGQRSATAIAESDTELLVLNGHDVMALLEREPSAMRAVLRALAQMIRMTNEKLSDAALLDVNGRMAKALLTLAERHGMKTEDGMAYDRPVTSADLASLTGLHVAEVDRLLQRYQYEDLIRMEQGRIILRRVDDLKKWIQY